MEVLKVPPRSRHPDRLLTPHDPTKQQHLKADHKAARQTNLIAADQTSQKATEQKKEHLVLRTRRTVQCLSVVPTAGACFLVEPRSSAHTNQKPNLSLASLLSRQLCCTLAGVLDNAGGVHRCINIEVAIV